MIGECTRGSPGSGRFAEVHHRGTEDTEDLHTGEVSPCRDEM